MGNETNRQIQELERRLSRLEQTITRQPSRYAEPGGGGGGAFKAVIVREIPDPLGFTLMVEDAAPIGDPWEGTWGGVSDVEGADPFEPVEYFTWGSKKASYWDNFVWPKTVLLEGQPEPVPNPPVFNVTLPMLAFNLHGIWVVTQTIAHPTFVLPFDAAISPGGLPGE